MTLFRDSRFSKLVSCGLVVTMTNLSMAPMLPALAVLNSQASVPAKLPAGLTFPALLASLNARAGKTTPAPGVPIAQTATPQKAGNEGAGCIVPAATTPVLSRALTADELQKKGKDARNPYIAGSQKFSVNVNGLDVLTGNYTTSATDLMFEGGYGVPINVTRSYSANNMDEGPVGKGWTLSVDIRNTAGGLLKSSGSPTRSVPLTVRERPSTQEDPHADPEVTEPADAVIMTDASGFEETVQKDVDGILTTPAWDKNVNDVTYETVIEEGNVYQVLLTSKTITPEGTEYVYAKEGSYESGTHPWNDPGAEDPEPSNILKIQTVTDRHGNVTHYEYSAENETVTFDKSNGEATETMLESIDMPGGHTITFAWGDGTPVPTNRIETASDGTRTVTYGYDEDGNLDSVTSPAGYETTYGYGPPDLPELTNYDDLLTSITDCRGLTTSIAYVEAPELVVPPYNVELPETGVVCYRIEQPNEVTTHLLLMYTPPWPPNAYSIMFGEFKVTAGDAVSDPTITQGQIHLIPDDNDPKFTVTCGIPGTEIEEWSKTYDGKTHDLIEESRNIWPYPLLGGDLSPERQLDLTPFVQQRIETVTEYNFMGAPLTKTVTEKDHPVGGSMGTTRTAAVEYAYHGADKYYQQKAVKDQGGRISFTDYFSKTATDGKKGQVYKTYSSAFATFDNTGSGWKDAIIPVSGTTYSAEFDYDTAGRCTLVKKLHTTGSPNVYVHTTTAYGDGEDQWGNAIEVIEDADYSGHSGIERTTETLTYDSIGRATEVKDGADRVFETEYDLDGRILTIKRTDTTPDVDIVTYTYGDDQVPIENGMPITITDELSGVVQTIGYDSDTGGGKGQVEQIEETDGAVSYTTAYVYNSAGVRSRATYTTPQSSGNNAMKWDYDDYLWVGSPDSGGLVFQTLNKVEWNGSAWVRTDEEFHYQFDASGRLAGAAFAQTPNDDFGAPESAPFYTEGYPGERRARAWYDYDPAGRINEIRHWWDTTSSSYPTLTFTSAPILGATYAYELTGDYRRGLRTDADFYKNVSGSWSLDKAQEYEYDNQLDYLKQAEYDDDGNSSWDATHTWDYYANGNRKKENNGADWTYDELNRILTSPSSVSYGHDILGNRTTKTGGVTYSWDVINRMTQHAVSGGATTNYKYRADGMRTFKSISSTHDINYRYDGQMLMEEFYTYPSEPEPTTIQTIRYGLGARGIDYIERVPLEGAALVGFPIYDGHGNMVATLLRSTSSPYHTLGDQRSYDAWGKIRSGNTGGEPNPRYVGNLGHVQDDESGLIYMRARYYEPATGRFISEDPATHGQNWYVYCWNNPIGYVDKTGKEPLSQNAYYNNQILMGFAAFAGAALLLMPFASIKPSPKERLAAYALLALAAYNFSEAIGETSYQRSRYLRFMEGVAVYAGAIAVIAELMGRSRVAGGFAMIAAFAAGLYSISVIGLLTQIDIGNEE